jgi:peptidoglycan L-alanyl-D-glutamate endopeptidase CwlK
LRDIELLHPRLRTLCRQLIDLSRQNGIEIIITQTLRTRQEQDALYAQGRTASGNIVTNVRYPYSMHCWGLAFDVAVMLNGKVTWNRLDLYDRVGQLGKSLGLRWGGDFKTLKDRPRFELPGYDINQMIKQYQSPDRFTATFKEEVKVFKDLVNHWAEKDVKWLAENGIVQTAEYYRPNDTLTRAEAAALIARSVEFILKKIQSA